LDGVDAPARNRALRGWREAPSAMLAQPEPDHLLPLMVAAGAAGDDVARVHFRQDDFFGHLAISSYRFG
jgi:aromatic ring-opening dioxygenase catalytic subunit (LigB family)